MFQLSLSDSLWSRVVQEFTEEFPLSKFASDGWTAVDYIKVKRRNSQNWTREIFRVFVIKSQFPILLQAIKFRPLGPTNICFTWSLNSRRQNVIFVWLVSVWGFSVIQSHFTTRCWTWMTRQWEGWIGMRIMTHFLSSNKRSSWFTRQMILLKGF